MRPTRSPLRGLAVLAGSLVLTMMPRIARADADDAARAEARSLASQGDEAFARGRCDVAVPFWKQAEARFHAPTLLFRVARCQTILGKVVDAAATLEAIVAEKLGPSAPAPFLDAQRDATAELPSVKARIATLAITIDDRGIDATPIVTVDDARAPSGDARLFALDPGTHRVRVSARDAVWEQSVSLVDGEKRVIRVALTSVQAKAPLPPQRLVGYILGGVGIASMAVGGYFGATAVSDQHALRNDCGPEGHFCPQGSDARISALRTKALVADLTIGGGAAVFIAGAIVVLTAPTPKREEPRVFIAPMGMGAQLGGRF
jgi:hypothetical protein